MDGVGETYPGLVLLPLHATEVDLKQVVAGFTFRSGGDEHDDRNGHICKIIGRAEPDGDALEPAFTVKFGDGHVMRAWADELQPWYPT
jgi:hypothetical protein